jgi:hypothetical protein
MTQYMNPITPSVGASEKARPTIWWLWLGVALMVGSIIAGIVLGVRAVGTIIDRVRASAAFESTGTYEVTVDHSDSYVIFTMYGSGVDQGSISATDAKVVIRDPSGAEVKQAAALGLDRSNDFDDTNFQFGSVVKLKAGQKYAVEVQLDDGIDSEARLMQSPMSHLRTTLRWGGWLLTPLFALGLITMIVVLIKRRNWRRDRRDGFGSSGGQRAPGVPMGPPLAPGSPLPPPRLY